MKQELHPNVRTMSRVREADFDAAVQQLSQQ